MARRSAFDELITLPWWLSLGLAGVVFVGLRYIVPAFDYANPLIQGLATRAAPMLALPFTALLVFAAGLSAFTAWRKRRLLDAQTGLESIQNQRWQQFEELVGEAFRRRGYQVIETGGGGPDGGIDLVLRKNGERTLVQCKRRRNSQVGVKDVREFFGVVMAEQAAGGILTTAGTFTREAKAFADGKPLELIAGPQLARMIRSVQTKPAVSDSGSTLPPPAAVAEPAVAPSIPPCPVCGSMMVLRTARQGKNAGNQFWGCSRFPDCKGTLPLTT